MAQPPIFISVLLLLILSATNQQVIRDRKTTSMSQSNIGNPLQQESNSHKNQPAITSAQQTPQNNRASLHGLPTAKQNQIQFNSHSQFQDRGSGTVSENVWRRTVYSRIKQLEQKVSQVNMANSAVFNQKSTSINSDQNLAIKNVNTTANQANLPQNKSSITGTTSKNVNNTPISSGNVTVGNVTNNNNNNVGKNNIAPDKSMKTNTTKNNQSSPETAKTPNLQSVATQKAKIIPQPKQIGIKNDSKIQTKVQNVVVKNNTSPPVILPNKTNEAKPPAINPLSPAPSQTKSESTKPNLTSTSQTKTQNTNSQTIANSISSQSPSFQQLANNLFGSSFNNNFFNKTNDQTQKLFDNFFNDTKKKSIFSTNDQKLFTNPFSSNYDPTKKQIVSKEFTGIGLYHDIPLSFLVGQVYKFHGIVLTPSKIFSTEPYKYNFVNIIFSEWGSKNQFRCVKRSAKDVEFQISCKMQKSGRYLLSIFSGKEGQSSSKFRSVRDSSAFMSAAIVFNLKTNYEPTNLTCEVVGNELEIRWGTVAPLTNLTLFQKQKNGKVIKKEFLLSNYHAKFLVPFAEFQEFQPTTTYVEVCHADSDDGSLYQIASSFSQQQVKYTFEAVEHKFSQEDLDLANISPPIPWRIKVGDTVKFNATFKENIRNQVYLILPTNLIAKVNFTKSLPANATVRAGTPLNLQLTFTAPGIYILEINAASGMAIINRPIYVGDGLPLIPDHKDLIDPTLPLDQLTAPKKALQKYIAKDYNSTVNKEPRPSASMGDKRNYLLMLLNNLRRNHKSNPVILDDQLNSIAQYHSDDMTKNNYFSHTSLNGDGPAQRAKKFGFNSPIGENIAQSNSLTQAHLSLQRSADHLQNSINPDWRRVGIGIATSSVGQYYVTFQFSGRNLDKQPFTKDELDKLRLDMVKLILQRNANVKQENKKLSQDVGDWMDTSRSVGIFQYLRDKKYLGAMSATSFSISYSTDLLNRLDATHYLEGFDWYKEVGVGLRMLKGQSEMLEVFAVFA